MARPNKARRAQIRMDTRHLAVKVLRETDPGLLQVAGLTEEEALYAKQYLEALLQGMDPTSPDPEE